MAMNIVDYVREFGDADFTVRPLCEVDSLIFSELSYLDYTGLVGDAFDVPLSELWKMHGVRLIADTLLPKSNRALLEAMVESPRYRDVVPGRFHEHNSEEEEVRFAAITFRIPGSPSYVAFRGTDVTFLGWKEDFNSAFLRSIPSQMLAASYLARAAKADEGELIAGGHSKGGNLAVFAAVNAPAEVRARIRAVYNHDGPGFKEDIFASEAYRDLEERIHKTVPHDSLIGILLHHTDRYRVVESRSVSFGQHNPFAWTVETPDSFKELPASAPISRLNDRALAEWIDGMGDDDRRNFVEAFYKVVKGSGAVKVMEFRRHFFRKVAGMRRAYKALSDRERELVKKGGKELIRIWFGALKTSLLAEHD